MTHPYYPAHFYATSDPYPQLVRVQNGNVWLPDNGKLVPVDKLEGRLVRLIEEPTQLPTGIPNFTPAPVGKEGV
jgi:hypothetical protein